MQEVIDNLLADIDARIEANKNLYGNQNIRNEELALVRADIASIEVPEPPEGDA